MSTSTSWTAPLAQRTSFASPRPPRPCMPRTTPFVERDWESWTNEAERTRRAKVVVEDVRVEGPGEQSAFVAEWLRDKGENISEGGLFNTHMEMLA